MRPESRARSESPSPAPPATPDEPSEAPKAAPIRELSLKLPGDAGTGVDLHIVDSKGKLHVEVRTGDAHLASSLQDNVGDLVGKLDRSGYRTEEATSRDGRVISAPGDSQQPTNDNGRQSGAERDQTAGQGGQSGQQHHHGQGRGNRPRWLEEIVKNFDPQVREEENQD